MGWTGVSIPVDKKAFLISEMTDANHEVIDVGVSGSTYYFAIKTKLTDATKKADMIYQQEADGSFVYAVIVITSTKGGEFLYKDMPEWFGPNEAKAPKRLMAKLSPLIDNGDFSAYAKHWRERVMNPVVPVNLPVGTKIKLVAPVSFGKHGSDDTFMVPGDSVYAGKKNVWWSAKIGYVTQHVTGLTYEIVKD